MKKALLLLVALAAIYLTGIASRDFWYPDEPDMAEITRQMVLSGQWLQLRWNGAAFADYPPLYFWLTAAAAHLGGWDEFVLRLPTTLAALGLLLLTFLWAQRRLGEGAALWSLAVLGTTFLFVYQAVNMHLDMLFALFIAAAVFCYDCGRDAVARRQRLGLTLATGVLMGLASLTKGPAGIVLPLGILAVDHLAHREGRALKRLAAAGAVAALFFLAWCCLYWREVGESDLLCFLLKQNVARFLHGRSHAKPVFFYFVRIWSDLMPWSLFLLLALPTAWTAGLTASRHAGTKSNRALGLALVWFAFIFLFFTISQSKRQVYLLPLYPAAAVLIGHFLAGLRLATARMQRVAGWVALFLAGLLVLGGVAAAIAVPRLQQQFPEAWGLPYPAGALVLAAVTIGLGVGLLTLRGGAAKGLSALAVGSGTLCLIYFGWLLPALDASLSAERVAMWLAAQARTGVIGLTSRNEASVLAFYGNVRVEVLDSAAKLRAFAREQPRGLIVVKVKPGLCPASYVSAVAGMPVQVLKEFRIGDDRCVAVRLGAAG